MATTSEKFWDNVAQRYSKQPISDAKSYKKKLTATQRLMTADMRVLELGCGTGSTAIEHAPYVKQIVATDISSAMVDIGRSKAAAQGVSNICFEQSSVVSYEAPAQSFDMVLALNLLHLVPNREAALAKVYSLLKPGGIFISSTVCLSDKMWFMRPVIYVMRVIGKAPYVEFLKASDVKDEVSSFGFQVQDHWSHGRANSFFLVAKK